MTVGQSVCRARRWIPRVRRAYRALRCSHTGGLVYEGRCRINDHWIVFSRCDCGHIFTWTEGVPDA